VHGCLLRFLPVLQGAYQIKHTVPDTRHDQDCSFHPPNGTLSMDHQSQQSTNTSDQIPCRLLDLPPELRNHIYEYLLLGGEDEAPVRVTDCLLEERGLPPIILQAGSEEIWQPPAILQTCQQIRDEATPVYYTTNTFDVFVDSRNLERTICRWLTALGSHIRDKIRTIHLGLMYDRLDVAETGLEMFDDMLNEVDCQVRQGTISVQVFERYAISDDVLLSPFDLLQIWPGVNGDYIWKARVSSLSDAIAGSSTCSKSLGDGCRS